MQHYIRRLCSAVCVLPWCVLTKSRFRIWSISIPEFSEHFYAIDARAKVLLDTARARYPSISLVSNGRQMTSVSRSSAAHLLVLQIPTRLCAALAPSGKAGSTKSPTKANTHNGPKPHLSATRPHLTNHVALSLQCGSRTYRKLTTSANPGILLAYEKLSRSCLHSTKG